MKTKLKLHLLFLAILSASALARAQGTSFTYQGRLNENGSPANGDYDLKFSIFDDPIAGSQVGDSLTNAPTSVSNGLFTVTLDFGAGVFTGAPRWLEIGVTANGNGEDFTALSPRQALTASPYAIFAGTSANVASGSVVTSLNGLKDDVTLEAGANVTLTPNGNTLTLAAAGVGGSGIWSVLNNNAYYNAGNVGIGTAAPLASLDVLGNWNGEQGALNLFGDRPSVRFTGDAGSANQSWLMHLGGGPGDLLFYRRAAGAEPWIPTLSLGAADGNVGLGTTTPQAKLHIYDPAGSVTHVIETGGGINAWTRVDFANANGQWRVGTSRGFNGDQFYFYRRGATVNAFAIQPNGDASLQGTMSCNVLTIRGGADVAEPFAMPEEIAKGSVMVIDDAHPGQLKLSAEAYDTRVAGIVSGANGINPGIALHQQGAIEGGQNVALSGRVYVQADAAFGAIRPGDLLTTSDTPGHAMKVTDHAKSQGAILGKAMGSLSEGKGMVLVLVTLQ
jgi:hypothetical protein